VDVVGDDHLWVSWAYVTCMLMIIRLSIIN